MQRLIDRRRQKKESLIDRQTERKKERDRDAWTNRVEEDRTNRMSVKQRAGERQREG